MSHNPAVSSFCRKTRRTLLGTVRVSDGQHLHYFVTARGETPAFTLACGHKVHFNAAELGPPRMEYDVIWPKSAADEEAGQDGEDYTFAMSFVDALKYTLRVELHNAAHQRVGDGVIVDADYESENAEALCNESFVVRTK
jgi:hypothetical protein